MPLRDKYQPVVDLIKEMRGEVLKAEEDRGYFVIEGLLNSEEEINKVRRKVQKINDINADEIKLKLELRS